MSYGIQCINESGFTQIDATFDNVAVFASGTMSSSFVGGTVTKTSIPANTPADYLIFCNFGLEVYKQNTEEAFSSNNQNFRCLQVSFDVISTNTQSGSTFTLDSMTNIYSLMSGKTLLGRLPVSQQNSPVALQSPGGGSVGGGYKTNLIGVFA